MTAAAQTATPPAQDATFAIDRRARFEILGAVMLALFLAALDQTIVGTALPRILTELHGTQLYTWVVTIYLLTATVSGPLYGKLSDQFGRRPMLMIGISLFLFGSLLWPVAGDVAADRCSAASRAWAPGPSSRSPGRHRRPLQPAERGKYQGLFGARLRRQRMLIGPALGGFLTDNYSWHWIFFVNMPIGAGGAGRHLAPAARHQAPGAGASRSTTWAPRSSPAAWCRSCSA